MAFQSIYPESQKMEKAEINSDGNCARVISGKTFFFFDIHTAYKVK